MSVLFVGGPADGLSLTVSRAPFYLRVVTTMDGDADVLDKLGDEPRDDEQIAVYVRPGEALATFVSRAPGSRCATCATTATYVHLDDVDGETVRDTEAWRAWATRQPPAGQGRVGETRWPPVR